ncbi:hypothetical protein, partial [Youngiibacter fragilis]|uniref:hypothetical protein n=1 Tax=Youngiibacter fragilis TaxID=1408819 RepID=UPI001A9A6CD6
MNIPLVSSPSGSVFLGLSPIFMPVRSRSAEQCCLAVSAALIHSNTNYIKIYFKIINLQICNHGYILCVMEAMTKINGAVANL